MTAGASKFGKQFQYFFEVIGVVGESLAGPLRHLGIALNHGCLVGGIHRDVVMNVSVENVSVAVSTVIAEVVGYKEAATFGIKTNAFRNGLRCGQALVGD